MPRRKIISPFQRSERSRRNDEVAVFPAPVVHRGHGAGKPALSRYLPDHILTVPRPSPDMGQAKEIEGGPIRLRMSRTL